MPAAVESLRSRGCRRADDRARSVARYSAAPFDKQFDGIESWRGIGVNDEENDTRIYQVVVNDEEQYSIWPADQDPPAGWRPESTTGTKDECLARISAVWTDMRPRSLREHMDGTNPA
jgi:MbtH protein